MFTHIVIFTWLHGVSAEQIATFRRDLDQLSLDLSDMGTIRRGADLGIREGRGDYALVGTFADRVAWDVYQADPRHKAFVREIVSPLQADGLSFQFQYEE